MSAFDLPTLGSSVSLTGRQVIHVRRVLNESQAEFSRRFAVTQPVISRLESKENEPQSGPIIILIYLLARQYRINLNSVDAGDSVSA